MFPIIYIALVLLILNNIPYVYGDEKEEAILRISEAEDAIKSAYLSLLESERVGGDISELVELLNTALEYQFKANRALELGDFYTAINLDQKVIQISNEILNTDINLISVAKYLEEVNFRNQVLLSLGVTLSTIFLGFLSWRFFKKYYIRNLMASSLEVSADESG